MVWKGLLVHFWHLSCVRSVQVVSEPLSLVKWKGCIWHWLAERPLCKNKFHGKLLKAPKNGALESLIWSHDLLISFTDNFNRSTSQISKLTYQLDCVHIKLQHRVVFFCHLLLNHVDVSLMQKLTKISPKWYYQSPIGRVNAASPSVSLKNPNMFLGLNLTDNQSDKQYSSNLQYGIVWMFNNLGAGTN